MSRDSRQIRARGRPSAAKTLMTHSLNKEASQLLCDAMRCRVEDGDATAEDWTDSKGNALLPDRFWNNRLETLIAADCAEDCMGIEQNIWERDKVGVFLLFNDIMCIMHIIRIIRCCPIGTTTYSAHIDWRGRTERGIRCP